MTDSVSSILLYIQKSLYDGKQPNADAYYCYTAKELAENASVSLSTVKRSKEQVLSYLQRWCDFSTWAKFEDYAGEKLYQDVSFEAGVLKFQRNPLTFQEEFSFLWALPPLEQWFSYDAFDDKHRRRINGNKMIFDAVPWTWDADQYEEEIKQARDAIKQHWSTNLPTAADGM